MGTYSEDLGRRRDAPIGEFLDGYEPIRTIAQGSFGTAYLCDVRGRDERAVVKVTHPDLIRGARAETFRERFSSEVRSLASVSHPCLVRIHRAGLTASGLPAIAMEFVEGPTLEQRLSEGAPIAGLELVELLGQLGAALAVVHAEGIVHRDVSPQNIILRAGCERVRPVLLDFGVAGFLGEDDAQAMVGTPPFIAPERRFFPATEKSDMYSLGAIGWWAFAGEPDASLGATQRRDLLSRAALQPILHALLAVDPRVRPSALEVERWASAALDPERRFSDPVTPRVAIIGENPVTTTAVRELIRLDGANPVLFPSSTAFFTRRCRRAFDLVVVVDEGQLNPVVSSALGSDSVRVSFVESDISQGRDTHITRLPAERSDLSAWVTALSQRPAAWIARIEASLEAWRCVLDSNAAQCNHCARTVDEMGGRQTIAGSVEPPRLSRLLRAMRQRGEQRELAGLFLELQQACENAVRHRIKETANDDDY